jgi:hypothetical protein
MRATLRGATLVPLRLQREGSSVPAARFNRLTGGPANGGHPWRTTCALCAFHPPAQEGTSSRFKPAELSAPRGARPLWGDSPAYFPPSTRSFAIQLCCYYTRLADRLSSTTRLVTARSREHRIPASGAGFTVTDYQLQTRSLGCHSSHRHILLESGVESLVTGGLIVA